MGTDHSILPEIIFPNTNFFKGNLMSLQSHTTLIFASLKNTTIETKFLSHLRKLTQMNMNAV
jgi:hypothetical protein